MNAKPFLLYVIPRNKDDYGVALYQKQLRQNNNPKAPRRLVQVWGAPFHAIIDYFIETLKNG